MPRPTGTSSTSADSSVRGAQGSAQAALATRLRSLLPPDMVDRFIGGTHTQRFADNLLPSFSSDHVRALRMQLARGAGGELQATPTGKRPAHAPYSSAALAVNAFGGWLGRETEFTIAGIGGFNAPLSLEHKLRIAHGGGEANLDCVAASRARLVGIESKLTEYLAPHKPVPWRDPYRQPEMQGLLAGGWREVFQASLSRAWVPVHLGIEQLLKHALALNSHAGVRLTHLVYVFWEPANAADHLEVQKHREEVAEFEERVADGEPSFHAISYEDLFADWAATSPMPDWRSKHLKQLRDRYAAIDV